jgi:hypothetical protein
MSDYALHGLSWRLRRRSMGLAKLCFRPRWSRSRAGLHSARTALSFSRPASVRAAKATTPFLAFSPERRIKLSWKVEDPALSPLDLAIAPNGNVVVSSEHPFGTPDAVTTVREYDRTDGRLVRVLAPDRGTGFRNPRGLRFGPDGKLYCVAQDESSSSIS